MDGADARRVLNMPYHTLMRASAVLLSLAAIFLTGSQVPFNDRWDSFVYSLAFGHYLLSLIFSKRQVREIAAEPGFAWKVAGLLVLGGLFYYRQGFPLLLYFGIHHALNEVYQLERVTLGKKNPDIVSFRYAGIAVSLSVFLFLVRKQLFLDRAHPENPFPVEWLAGAVIMSYAVYFYRFRRVAMTMSRTERIDNCAAEVVYLALIFVSTQYQIRSNDVVAYHFLYWMMQPLPALSKKGVAQVANYIGMTALLFLVFFIVSPLGPIPYPLRESWFHKQFIFWSYFHITLTFALSNSNPPLLVNFFRPQAKKIPG